MGVEEIPNEVLKSPSLLNVLYDLFYFCFEHGIIPSAWYKSIVKPIPKSVKDDPRIPLNYRGISLLSTVYKIYSGILNARLTAFLETTEYLVDEQIGFRKHRACIDHIYSVSTTVRTRLTENKSTFICFVDFRKAFDWVDRDLLCLKLLQAGVDGKFYRALKSLYASCVGCVQVNEVQTEWFPIPCGVKQGDVLSPGLFSLFINDLALEIKHLNLGIHLGSVTVGILLYADDVALLAESVEDLQTMLNVLHNWCCRWRLVINQAKTQIIHFRKRSAPRSTEVLTFDNMNSEYVTHYKYLGFTFDEFMNFDGVKILAASASRALGSVINKLKVCKDLGYSTYTQLYDACVSPVLNYAAGVWGAKQIPALEAVENRAIRCFLGVHKFVPVLAAQGDMGWVPGSILRKSEMVRLWNRIIYMPDNRITKKVFLWSKSNSPWAAELQATFNEAQLQYIFHNNLHCNIKDIQTKLLSKFKDKWKKEILTKPKLRTYVQIKDAFETEFYVKSNLSRNQRSLIA